MPEAWDELLNKGLPEKREAALRFAAVSMLEAFVELEVDEKHALVWTSAWLDIPVSRLKRWRRTAFRAGYSIDKSLLALCPKRGMTGVEPRLAHLLRPRQSVHQMMVRKAIGLRLDSLRVRYPEDRPDAR